MCSTTRATRCAVLLLLLAAASCGSDGEVAPTLSSGLKIFVTDRLHASDFANDPTLTGANAIEKADDFCKRDPNNPGGATYRALIVDGTLRDAKTQTNWVLRPSTTYYRKFGNVEIGTTTAAAIFAAAYTPLTNAVEPAPSSQSYMDGWRWTWTGIANAADFTAGDSCSGWTTLTTGSGWNGVTHFAGGGAFASGMMVCSGAQLRLYCVQQP